jgi:hypothetical protein
MFPHLLLEFSPASRRPARRSRFFLEQLEARTLPAPLTWVPGLDLPAAEGGVVAAQTTNSATAILGGTTTNVVDFQAANPAWRTVLGTAAALDQVRTSPGVGVLPDGNLLVFGGQDNGTVLAGVWQYDYSGATTDSADPMSTPRTLLGFATDENHRIYALGGKDAQGQVLASVERYILDDNAWTPTAPLPRALDALSVVADGAGHLFAFGGMDAGGNLSAIVYRYTIATDSWDTVAPLPVATADSAAVLGPNGLIYVLGGITSTGTTANVESYTEATDTWTTETALPAPVSGAAATVDSLGRIIVAGGFDADNQPTAGVVVSQQLNQPDAAPVITSVAPAGKVVTDTAFSYQVLSTGNPQPTYTLTTAPAGMTIDANTGLISWTPAAAGSQTVTIQAGNDAGQTTQTFTIQVVPAAPTDLTATGASTSSLALSWSATTDPSVSSYNVYQRFFIHSPRGSGGSYVYSLIASNVTANSFLVTGLGSGKGGTYVVKAVTTAGVASANSAPASGETWVAPALPTDFLLTNGAVYSSAVNVTVGQSVQITLLGTGNPAPTYSVVSGPSTVSVDPKTGVVTYTPAASEVGPVNITFQAANVAGTATQTVPFNVTAPTSTPATPTITVSGGSFVYDGTTHAASATAVGVDGVTPISGSFTFTYNGSLTLPTDAGTYTVEATFTSSDPSYGAASGNGSITIGAATPAFSILSSPTIAFGTASATLSGHLAAGAVVPTGTNVAITLDGVTQTATVDGNGDFSSRFDTSMLSAAAHSITYAFAGATPNFNAAVDGTGTLTVLPAPVPPVPPVTPPAPTLFLTVSPLSQTVKVHGRVIFTAAATGDPAPTVQWQISSDGGATFINIPGATATTLTFRASARQNGNQYRAVFSNAAGTVASTAATLTMKGKLPQQFHGHAGRPRRQRDHTH